MARRKKNEDEPKENKDNINNDADDTFGLPEVDYQPLKRDEVPVSDPAPSSDPLPVQAEEPSIPIDEPVVIQEAEISNETYHEEHVNVQHEEHIHVQQEDANDYASSYHYEPEKPVWPKALGIILLLLLAGGAIYYFAVYQPGEKEALRLRTERAAEIEASRKREAEKKAANEARQLAEQRRLDSLANVPSIGSIEMLTRRTGQYYIVVASAIDDDLLIDYANELIKTGKSVKIVPPFGKTGKFYRLAIDSKGSYADAQASADGLKGGEFGDQLWVVRY